MRNWTTIKEYKEILFDFYNGIARITINRPRYRNAFTPLTVAEMSDAFRYCREAQDVCVVVLTGAGDKAFCAGGDMSKDAEDTLAVMVYHDSTCLTCKSRSVLFRNL